MINIVYCWEKCIQHNGDDVEKQACYIIGNLEYFLAYFVFFFLLPCSILELWQYVCVLVNPKNKLTDKILYTFII